MKILNLFAVSYIALLSISQSHDDDQQILFCAKNLELSGSSPALSSQQRGANPQNTKIIIDAFDTFDHGRQNHIDLRHCFIARAKVKNKDGGVLRFSQLETHGYGLAPFREEGDKTGTIGPEIWQGNEIVGCVPVLQNLTRSAALTYWGEALNRMDLLARERDYSAFDHNCCTVAYDAIQHIEGDLSGIDPSSFNLKGVGVIWKGSDLIKKSRFSHKIAVWKGELYDFSGSSLAREYLSHEICHLDGTENPLKDQNDVATTTSGEALTLENTSNNQNAAPTHVEL